MRYSLLNQFRGVFLGAALGEILGATVQQANLPIPWRSIDAWGFQGLPPDTIYFKAVLTQAQSLLANSPSSPPIPFSLGLIPLILFHHDDAMGLPIPLSDSDQMFTEALMLALNHQHSALGGSELIVEDFRLTLLQTLQQADPAADLPLLGAIAGAISGAYNSFSGIPLSWRRLLDGVLVIWDLPPQLELLALSDRLYAAWAGVHLTIPQVGAMERLERFEPLPLTVVPRRI